jgi:peptide/nickel transport system substrate-binding protein
MRMKKKIIWILVSFLMVVSLIVASCGKGEEGSKEGEFQSPETPKYGGWYITLAFGDPSGFDPRIVMNLMCPTIWVTHDELVTGDWAKGPVGTGETDWRQGFLGQVSLLKGQLVEDWELPDDETIIYHVKQGIHFSYDPKNMNPAMELVNGKELTAEDIAWSLESEWFVPGMNEAVFFKPEQWIISAKAIDKWTVEIKTPANSQGLNLIESCERISIFAPEVTEKWGDQNDWTRSVGVGAFMLTDYVVGSSLTFTRTPNYFDHDPLHPENQLPYIDGMKQMIIPDLSSQLAAFRTGKIDMMEGLSWENGELLLKDNSDLKYIKDCGMNLIPCGREDKKELPFDDIRVRKAMNLAVDQQEILDDYLEGHGQLMGWPFYDMAAHTPFYTPLEDMPESVQELYTYNLDKAKELLAEAGYPDGFKTKIACVQGHVDLLSIVREYLLKVNIDMELQVLEGGEFNNVNRARSFDEMIMKETKMYSMPWHMFEIRDDNADGVAFYENPKTRAVYNIINENLGRNDAVWTKALKDIVPFMIEESWGIWLPVPETYLMWWPWIQNFHGETWIGNFTPYKHAKYMWIDTEMKTKMGY